jgi:hypothetical protein
MPIMHVISNGPHSDITPDITFFHDDTAKLVIEVAYEQSLLSAHTKVQQLLKIPGILGAIIIKIRFSLELTEERNRYKENACGPMIYLFYSKSSSDSSETTIPEVVISFGTIPLSLEEGNLIAAMTGFPSNRVSGKTESNPMECDQTGLVDFCHTIPPNTMLVDNRDDAKSITNYAMDDLPANHYLQIDLYEVKQIIR